MAGRRKRHGKWMRSAAPAAVGAVLGLAAVLLLTNDRDTSKPAPRSGAGADVARRAGPVSRTPHIRITRRDDEPRGRLKLPPLRRDSDAALPAWRRFAAPAPAAGSRPLIAVIIDDMGIDRAHSAAAVALPGPLTLSYLPYAGDIGRQTAAARRAGHELMVHVAMEPESKAPDPGPNVLAAGLGAREVERRLRWALGRFDGYVGINNHMGSRFTADPAAMALVMEELGRRGLLFIDSRTTTRTVGSEVAGVLGLPFAERDVFIDDDATAEVVAHQLRRTEEIARRTGSAIAIGHPHPVTLAGLGRWLPRLAERGFALAPVSAVVARRNGVAPARAARDGGRRR